MSQDQSKPQITCSGLWKIFGSNPEKILQNLDPELSRAQVQERTGHVIAVKDVSFEVQEGETFVVMGLSGSGKSTLVRCISRLVEPTKGGVWIDRDDVMAMSERQLIELRRHRMSMVFNTLVYCRIDVSLRTLVTASRFAEWRGTSAKTKPAKF